MTQHYNLSESLNEIFKKLKYCDVKLIVNSDIVHARNVLGEKRIFRIYDINELEMILIVAVPDIMFYDKKVKTFILRIKQNGYLYEIYDYLLFNKN